MNFDNDFGYVLDMASDNSSDAPDLDSRRNCPFCNIRMSSLLHDKHSICVGCRGSECSLESRCTECESWDHDSMLKYLKHVKTLASKSRSKKAKRSASVGSVRSSSEEPAVPPVGSGDLRSAEPLTEERVSSLISARFDELSKSFAASMEASFSNIQSLIDDRLATDVSVSNRSFPAPSPVPV